MGLSKCKRKEIKRLIDKKLNKIKSNTITNPSGPSNPSRVALGFQPLVGATLNTASTGDSPIALMQISSGAGTVILVVNNGSDNVTIYDPSLAVINTYPVGLPTPPTKPIDITLNDANVWILCQGDNNIYVLNYERGTLIKNFLAVTDATTDTVVSLATVGTNTCVAVSNSTRGYVQVYDKNFNLIITPVSMPDGDQPTYVSAANGYFAVTTMKGNILSYDSSNLNLIGFQNIGAPAIAVTWQSLLMGAGPSNSVPVNTNCVITNNNNIILSSQNYPGTEEFKFTYNLNLGLSPIIGNILAIFATQEQSYSTNSDETITNTITFYVVTGGNPGQLYSISVSCILPFVTYNQSQGTQTIKLMSSLGDTIGMLPRGLLYNGTNAYVVNTGSNTITIH